MVKIQIDIPEELMHKVAVESVEKSFHDKRVTIISILNKYFESKQQ